MNFLAHLALAEPTPAAWVGSILPDLARGQTPRQGDAALMAAIRQHRRVDAFTDTHPVVLGSKARLRPRHGRYAGILLDIFFDHFLARDFPSHTGQDLDAFIAQVHAGLHHGRHLAPEAVRPVLDRLIAHDWLRTYATPAGIHLTLARLSDRLTQRFGHAVDLAPAVADLLALDRELGEDFDAFFPQLWQREKPRSQA